MSREGSQGRLFTSTQSDEDIVPTTNQPQEPPTLSTMGTGGGIAIAAIWVSACLLLGFLAWLLVTRVHLHSGGVAYAYYANAFMMISLGYFVFAIIVLSISAWGTFIIRTGKS